MALRPVSGRFGWQLRRGWNFLAAGTRRETADASSSDLRKEPSKTRAVSPAPHEGLQNTLQRGWYWGSQGFREKMLKLVKRALSNRNYRTSALGREKDRREAEFWFEKTSEHLGLGENSLTAAPRPARLAAAWVLHHRTNQPQHWIADQLITGDKKLMIA